MPTFSYEFMAWSSGVAIALYLGFLAYALLSPVKQHDPQRGQAIGCLMLLLIPGALLGLLLAIGVMMKNPTVVRITFYVTAVPIFWVLMGVCAQPIFWLKRRRQERQWAESMKNPPPAEPPSGDNLPPPV